MKFNVLKKTFVAFTAVMAVALTACGGSSGRADEALVGSYIPVVGEMFGMALVGEDLDGFAVDLQTGGKATLTIEGEDHKVKWTNDDENLTLKIDGEEIVGSILEDAFYCEDMLGMGLNVTFAKEGTEAAKPGQYLPESDKFLLGQWRSESVADVLGDPVDDMADDALELTFTDDKMVEVIVAGENLGTFPWSNLTSFGYVDNDDVGFSLNWDILDDGIEVTYSPEEGYYVFMCPKQ